MCLLTCSGVLAVVALASGRTSAGEKPAGPETAVGESAIHEEQKSAPGRRSDQPELLDRPGRGAITTT
jgi:hypothetical protein